MPIGPSWSHQGSEFGGLQWRKCPPAPVLIHHYETVKIPAAASSRIDSPSRAHPLSSRAPGRPVNKPRNFISETPRFRNPSLRSIFLNKRSDWQMPGGTGSGHC
ncbi:hypothetical protein AVEN_248383-1 [Araneus ventricosus]|uniref:Uncharacterized protein n=1 Tax=Araneus ventricosus TaxID=182803 RepID=A0A4Y2LQ44_ARAVE|nr:hypothetical protein AVEN_248383-1 [Araneus ventricosus]